MTLYHSLEHKHLKRKACHFREGPVGKFITTALSFNANILSVGFYNNNTLNITVDIDEALIQEFEEVSGFGLTQQKEESN